jgi:hypothetical protein
MTTPSHLLRALLLVSALVPMGCASANIDTTDRQAFFFEARARKNLEGPDTLGHTHLEGAWTRATGSTSQLDYTIHTVNVGFGVEGTLGNEGWSGVAAGASLQRTEFESNSVSIEGDTSIGPYVALEGGWHATPIVEPLARMELAFYLPDFSSILGIEIGARFHVVEHGALFAGWKYTRYNFRDLTSVTSIEEIDLDASGLVLGLSLDF